MRFYALPETLEQDIATFEADIGAFKSGEIGNIQFKGIRVAHGVYEQRKPNTYMMRIRTPGGCVTPDQIRKVAETSELYGAEEFHVTTRGELQLHYVNVDNLINAYRSLVSCGLSTRGGGGNTIRNVVCSWDSGVDLNGVFDVQPYANALTTRLIAEADSWNLPRKFKIAFSDSDEDTAFATATCLGFIAKIKDGKKGFKVYVGGGMGSNPMLGHVMYDFVTEDRVYYITRAIKTVFDRIGDRRRKYQARLKYVLAKYKVDEFRKMVEAEMVKLPPGLELVITPIDNKAADNITLTPQIVDSPDFQIWKKRHVRKQKQAGLITVRIPLRLGDVQNHDGVKLAEFLKPFGDNCIRLSLEQNVHLRNIPEQFAGNVFNFLQTMESLSMCPEIISNLITCTGADTCKLGLCLPRGAAPQITDRLLKSKLNLDAMSDVNIHISGCPNSCGQHHAASLGFFGKVLRKDGEMLPGYNILAGAILRDGEGQFAQKVEEVSAKDLPNFIEDLLTVYQSKQTNYPNFTTYINGDGLADITTIAKKYSDLPTLQAKPEYYTDWGAEEPFSILKGQKAECSAGIFDMIDVDKKSGTEAKEAVQAALEPDVVNQNLYKIVFHASRMLLVTRGLEVRHDDQAFELFYRHFVLANIVPSEFKDIVAAAKARNFDVLSQNRDRVFALMDTVIKLYESMDDSLRFPADVAGAAPAAAVAAAPALDAAPKNGTNGHAAGSDVFKDFRGVGCPMNYVKTKLVLEGMKAGQTLAILLDDGAPIENVPNSVKLDGHAILEKQKQDDQKSWRVLIKKG